jgi:hypothetical protein
MSLRLDVVRNTTTHGDTGRKGASVLETGGSAETSLLYSLGTFIMTI